MPRERTPGLGGLRHPLLLGELEQLGEGLGGVAVLAEQDQLVGLLGLYVVGLRADVRMTMAKTVAPADGSAPGETPIAPEG